MVSCSSPGLGREHSLYRERGRVLVSSTAPHLTQKLSVDRQRAAVDDAESRGHRGTVNIPEAVSCWMGVSALFRLEEPDSCRRLWSLVRMAAHPLDRRNTSNPFQQRRQRSTVCLPACWLFVVRSGDLPFCWTRDVLDPGPNQVARVVVPSTMDLVDR